MTRVLFFNVKKNNYHFMTGNNLLDKLNSKQKEAVTAVDGPVLVIAGPGSGKTRCLTFRIAYLINQEIRPENILAITFTNKAAEEMKQRVGKLLQEKNNLIRNPEIGTFHATCLKILRRDIEKLGYNRNFAIYDSGDQLSLIKKIIKDLEINPDQFKPNTVKDQISKAKDELLDEDAYQERAHEYFPETIAKIYRKYQEELKQSNGLDFDDLIMKTAQLFKKHPEVLEKYQNIWKYILVDEAHDTNYAQYILTQLLADKNKNLWVIADPDQSIYAWRGADFRNILNFEKDYPNTKIISLEENYRSTKTILEAGHHLISNNTERKEKNLWTNNPQGDPLSLIESENEEEEAEFIIEEMEDLMSQKGYSLKDFAVLYRTNAQSRAVEEAFLRANFPYKIIGTVKFYERKEIKDILAYLRFLANEEDLMALQRIINLPPRRLARYTKDPSQAKKDEGSVKALDSFYEIIGKLKREKEELPLTSLIKKVIQEINYKDYLYKSSQNNDEAERRWENLQELLTVANKHNREESGRGLEKFLEEVTLFTSSDEVDTNQDLVNLMTLHCAKGLEFPVVFIVGCEEGIFPHSRSIFTPTQMEEERRLCYVGITRGKQRTYLTFARQRRLFGQTMANPPSRFLGEIPEELVEYRNY